MRIMLVCGAGVSTSILMKKMMDYSKENNIELEVKAYGFEDAIGHFEEYDCVLIGPQIAYRIDDIKEVCQKPISAINPMDYGMGNAESVIKAAQDLLK